MSDLITVVYTIDLESTPFILECKKNGKNCISAVDARSAVYMATGICAQNQCKVAVCVDAGNASRGAFSGMTEAFYRKLPVALITIGRKLDYTKELNDVVVGHYTVQNYTDAFDLMNKEFPMHIELTAEVSKLRKIECNKLQQILSSALGENEYLYIAQGVKKADCNYVGKVVYGGMPGCYEGALANVLGASLAKRHKKYIGLVSEDELIHDLNTLGNININDLVSFIIVGNKKNDLLMDCATALQFEVSYAKESQISDSEIRSACLNSKKTLLMVYKEEG